MRDELNALLGLAESYLADQELRRESEALRDHHGRMLMRENADIRADMLAQGTATEAELDAAGIFSHEQLDEHERDGTLEEAMVGKAFGLAANFREDAVKRDHGKFSTMNVAGAAPKMPALRSRGAAGPASRGKVKLPGPGAVPAVPSAPQVAAPVPAAPSPPSPAVPAKAAPSSVPAKAMPTPDKDGWHDVGSDVNMAADLLSQGKQVRLSQPREASVLLSELAKRVQAAKAAGDAAPNFDLCKVTVKNTNLFCAESKGIPRVKMPQFGGVPKPGSPADGMAKDEKGSVDLSGLFRKMLEDNGAGVSNEEELASHLKASQIELNGAKVASMTQALDAGQKLGGDPRIFVSHDGYIVDGHHRWAANVGHDLGDASGEQDVKMPVARVDMDIIELLDAANHFTKAMGIPQQGFADSKPSGGTGDHAAALGRGELPENGGLYFNTDPEALKAKYGLGDGAVQDVPMDSIKPSRARPEGIANAKPLMAKAGLGQGGKRDPITLVKQPDGSHKVFDGNSTFAIAKEAGWKNIPAIVVNSDAEAAKIEATAKAAKADAKAAPARRAAQQDALKAMYRPEEAAPSTQSFASADALFSAAAEANDGFRELLTEGLPEALGASVPSFDDALVSAVSDPSKPQVLLGPLKKRARAMQKIEAKYDGDHNRLKDVVRGTVLVGTVGDMPAMLDEVRARAAALGWEIRDAEDKINESPPPPWVKGPTSAGYADTKVTLMSPNGVAAELQFNTNAMFAAKEGRGHEAYAEQRTIEADIKARAKAARGQAGQASPGTGTVHHGPTAAELAKLTDLKNEAKALYGKALEASFA